MPNFVPSPPATQSLDGDDWRFRRAGERRWLRAVVPGTVHADLHREGRIPDPLVGRNEFDLAWIEEADWTYALEFEPAPELWRHEQMDLVAEGIDTVATILLNGAELGRTENMFVAHRWTVRPHLRRGKNRLEIRFGSPLAYIRTHRRQHRPREINDPVGGCTRLRKQQCSFSWDWGPRLATSGIWRPIHLEGWTDNRIVSVAVRQDHRRQRVMLTVVPELARPDARASFRTTVHHEGQLVAEADGLQVTIPAPQLWWPHGHGEQPLYAVRVELRQDGTLLDAAWRRIGLRTIELDRRPDAWGERFAFRVNGRAIFAKGANWIPAHAVSAARPRAEYEALLRAATAAHMNMIRVWGGGVYEPDEFYDLCDELGLLVWQDFMFACTLYPGDRAFLRSVETEAIQQVTRLRHHASLTLWCGNNEIESLNPDALRDSAADRRAYHALFERLLRRVVAEHDGVTPYWRSSPLGSQNEGQPKDAAKLTGDWHDWDVWHARHPVKHYEKSRARFVSEFGMQSFCSPTVAATFSSPTEWNAFSPTLEAHQKNPSGNAIILDYVSRRYRFPRDYAALAYLSQLNQAYCMQVAVEHWRRSQPRTMGALYWQLNDCWPVASWSSLEFGGRWKPLHHAARRFFAPVIVSAQVPGDETRGIGNRLRSDVHRVELHVVSDSPAPVRLELAWELWQLAERRVLQHGGRSLRAAAGRARVVQRLDFSAAIARHGRAALGLRVIGRPEGLPASDDVVLFTAPKHLDLVAAPIAVAFEPEAGGWRVRLTSPVYQHGVWLDLPGETFEVSDNAFDLLPGVSRTVTLVAPGVGDVADLGRRLVVRSLVDAYGETPFSPLLLSDPVCRA